MKVSKATLTRTILLALALLNQTLIMTNHSPLPVDDSAMAEYISWTFTGVMSVINWWKNNSFTRKAIQADEYMSRL